MSMQALLIRQREAYLKAMAENAKWCYERVMGLCESPIEQLLIGELLAQSLVSLEFGMDWLSKFHGICRPWQPMARYPKCILPVDGFCDADTGLSLQCPVKTHVGEYRLDFAIIVDWPSYREGAEVARIVVECDGHDFHERTKEQAASDRARDRDLTANGWLVARFTGSELYRSPGGCVGELARIVRSTDRGART
jgi:very-short-patch-repair endonuclease